MKQRLLALILLGCALPAFGQYMVTATFSASAASCAVGTTPASCLFFAVPLNINSVDITIAGTYSGTNQFEVSGDGGSTWVSVLATPPGSTTAVTSTTSTGTWTVSAAAHSHIRVRCSTYSSGGPIVSINPSQAVIAGSGGGGSGVTSVSGTSPVTSSGGNTPAIGCATCVTTGGTNTYTTGANDFTGATSILVPTQTAGDSSTKGASTAFVTTAVSNAIAGVNPAVAVQAATTQASDTSSYVYANGVSGIGATLTGPTNNVAVVIDGVTFTAVGQRLLVKNDTQSPSGAFNGVYSLTILQGVANKPVLTRALDYDMPSDMNNTGAIPVVNGTANAQTQWAQTSQVTTVGTDAVTFTQFSINPTTVVSLAGTQALTNKDLTGAGNTFPTLNQNTTGSAAKWTTARNLAGNSVDGSAAVNFTNKVIEQGTTDSGFSSAQFLGAIATGIVWNTTTTGVLSTASPTPFTDTGRTTAITTASLCTTTNCPTGTYLISVYLAETGTGCGSVGSGTATPTLSWLDKGSVNHTATSLRGNNNTAAAVLTMALTTQGNNFFEANYVVTTGGATSGSDAFQIAVALTACTTPNSWSGYRTDIVTTRIQ